MDNVTLAAAIIAPTLSAAMMARRRAAAAPSRNLGASLAGTGPGVVPANGTSPRSLVAARSSAAVLSFSSTSAIKIAGPTPTLVAAALGTALPFGAPAVNAVSINSSPTKDGANLGPQALSLSPKPVASSPPKNGKKDCCCCDPCSPKNGNAYTPDFHNGTTPTQYPSNYTISNPAFWEQTGGKHSKGTYTGASGSYVGPGPKSGPAPASSDTPIIYT